MSAKRAFSSEVASAFSRCPFGWFLAWPVLLVLLLSEGLLPRSGAAVPPLLHYQGRVLVDGRVFDGIGRFKFALVNADGSQTWWRNAPDGNADGEPDAAVEITVTRGLYALLLGDTALTHMAALPPTALDQGETWLRVWFSDGTGTFERFVPDHRVAAAGYSLVARTVEDGAITTAKLAPDAITPGLVPPLDAGKITSGQLDPARLPAGVADASDVAALQTALMALTTRVANLEITTPGGGPTAVLASQNSADTGLGALGYERFATLGGPAWRDGSADDALDPRTGPSGVWSGTEWLVWGGQIGPSSYSRRGAAYDPAADAWSGLSELGTLPSARYSHSAVWTGSEMIVFGGLGAGTPGFAEGGGRFHVPSGHWSLISGSGSPAPRVRHVAAWCTNAMVIWGGFNSGGLLGDGALYFPGSDVWAVLSASNAPTARQDAASAVAGDRVFIWGGEGENGPVADGAALVLTTGNAPQWQPMGTGDAPGPRRRHSMVWTGSRLIVWGGQGPGNAWRADGGSYDPATQAWQPLPSDGAPSPRAGHHALWTGTEMIVVAGEDGTGQLASGAAYHPGTAKWRPLTNAGNPTPRVASAAAWTGTEILIFGGRGPDGFLGALERLEPTPTWHLFRKP